jgi:hypothetical protein
MSYGQISKEFFGFPQTATAAAPLRYVVTARMLY